MPTVIVEPDSVGAWLGLAGVALGATLTTGATWLQSLRGDRKSKRREIVTAADDLRAGATLYLLIAITFDRADDRKKSVLDWMPLLMDQTERIQRSAEVIQRLGPLRLAELAANVADEALSFEGGIIGAPEPVTQRSGHSLLSCGRSNRESPRWRSAMTKRTTATLIFAAGCVLGGFIGFIWHAPGRASTWTDVRGWATFAVVVLGFLVAGYELDLQRRQFAEQAKRNKPRDALLDGQLREVEQRELARERDQADAVDLDQWHPKNVLVLSNPLIHPGTILMAYDKSTRPVRDVACRVWTEGAPAPLPASVGQMWITSRNLARSRTSTTRSRFPPSRLSARARGTPFCSTSRLLFRTFATRCGSPTMPACTGTSIRTCACQGSKTAMTGDAGFCDPASGKAEATVPCPA